MQIRSRAYNVHGVDTTQETQVNGAFKLHPVNNHHPMNIPRSTEKSCHPMNKPHSTEKSCHPMNRPHLHPM
ncbi:UNVERIFIED_CONTAM: hypothetical protein Slati_3045100 [Sesamum latifolium]|uniref:Uncharacterized protein n=1 Tax=Sesamum latifolium TaxID=2727402 RepID=A0AAW2UTH5_9LAMI